MEDAEVLREARRDERKHRLSEAAEAGDNPFGWRRIDGWSDARHGCSFARCLQRSGLGQRCSYVNDGPLFSVV
jgi:hypothetical protein